LLRLSIYLRETSPERKSTKTKLTSELVLRSPSGNLSIPFCRGTEEEEQ
jgi:hypothetical protein